VSFTLNEAIIFALSARESRADENDGIMKKAADKNNEMLREYEFSKCVRGKYAEIRRRRKSLAEK
jgi:hypothetical protein